MTTVYFIRHGEAEGNVKGVCHGRYDSNLTDTGKLQAQLTADKLKDIKFDKIYSSDLKRAYETALPIAKSQNLEIITDKALQEIFVGDWEDKTWDYINETCKDAYELWKYAPDKMQSPNGESMMEACERIVGAVSKIVAENQGSTICVISHCCVLKNLICYYKGKDLSKLNEEYICNASYSIVEFDDQGKPNIISISNVSHLEEAGYIAKHMWV